MLRFAVCGLVALGLWLAVSGICRLLKKKLRQVAGAGVLAILMCATVLSAAMTNNFTTLEEKEELRALQSQEQNELQVLAGLLVPQEDQLPCGETLPNLLGSVAESKTFPHWAHGIYEDGQRVCFELDAALDDANIGRFVEQLKEFLVQSQFLIITHNQHTIAGSDIVYGVSQQEKGISRVISMKLTDIGVNAKK